MAFVRILAILPPRDGYDLENILKVDCEERKKIKDVLKAYTYNMPRRQVLNHPKPAPDPRCRLSLLFVPIILGEPDCGSC